MAKMGTVQARVLALLESGDIAYRRFEHHQITERSHSITVRWCWEGDVRDSTARSLVRNGWAEYVKNGARVVGLRITDAGRAAKKAAEEAA